MCVHRRSRISILTISCGCKWSNSRKRGKSSTRKCVLLRNAWIIRSGRTESKSVLCCPRITRFSKPTTRLLTKLPRNLASRTTGSRTSKISRQRHGFLGCCLTTRRGARTYSGSAVRSMSRSRTWPSRKSRRRKRRSGPRLSRRRKRRDYVARRRIGSGESKRKRRDEEKKRKGVPKRVSTLNGQFFSTT